jgi:hypothetical protein
VAKKAPSSLVYTIFINMIEDPEDEADDEWYPDTSL